ncbi:MAG: c-type cytochrome [Planctomycetia bacterium]|nr:c-type cytochrome [Planctomycetia bacterium]
MALVPTIALLVVGCERSVPPAHEPSSALTSLSKEDVADPEKLRNEINEQLLKHCGTPLEPKLIGHPESIAEHLAYGAEVYRLRCAACHGTTGYGDGPAAKTLLPLPRDYSKGIFKFVSVVDGVKPLRDDLMRTVRRGARGTSMPAFGLLPQEDLEAVVDYVLVLTHRGELESALREAAVDDEEPITDGLADKAAKSIVAKWVVPRDKIIHPMTAEPPYTWASIQQGKEAFSGTGGVCFKCHDRDGSARNLLEVGKDPWGHDGKAADLTSGMFHGGATSLDIYRRIYGGVKPMPAFANAYAKDPDVLWHLVHYVQYVSGARRRELLDKQAPVVSTSPESPGAAKTDGE